MPTAAILTLQAQEDGRLLGASGQHAHGFWLNQWKLINPAVGDSLHGPRTPRQYTVSPFIGLGDTRRGRTKVNAGDIAHLRLTTLDDQHQAHILEEWLAQLPDEACIGGLNWQRQREIRAAVDHPDAGQETYSALSKRYRQAGHLPQRWHITLQTPTAFHLGGDRYQPFPLPEKLLGSWLDLWNTYAPQPILSADDAPQDFLARIAAGLLVSRYKLKTVSFRFRFKGREVPQIGCVGEITLDGRTLSAADRAVVAVLADFAFYCGSGHHTTMGMGQTRTAPRR